MIDVPQRVKDSLREGSYHKNWRIIVLADESNDQIIIENDNLVKDSIRLDERMCSGDQLKFGLCEGSSFEFQYFGYPNIKGRRIQVFLDIEFETEEKERDWFTLPMGFFDVDQCPRQFDTGIMKVTSFNKLRSKYLDEKANAKIIDSMDNPDSDISFVDIRRILLDGYEIIEEDKKTFDRGTVSNSYYIPINNLKISRNYGIDNSFCLTIINTSATYRMLLEACGREYRFSNPSVVQIDKPDIDLENLERDVFNYIYNYLKDVPMNMTIDQFMENLFNIDTSSSVLGKSWASFFGIEVYLEQDGNRVRKTYSTVGYEHRCENIDGTLKDLFSTTFKDCYAVQFNLPRLMSLLDSNYERVSFLTFSDRIFENVYYPYDWYIDSSKKTTQTSYLYPYKMPNGEYMNEDIEFLENVYRITNYTSADLIQIKPTELTDITLREATSAVYELNCQFGQLDRETDLFSGVELNNHRLYPSELLYPRDDLFPISQAERANASMYQKLWTDEGSQKRFKDLIITYKTIGDDGNPVERTLQRQVNADGNVNYNMSDNWLFKNLLWSAESVGSYADAMVEKMKSVSWIPFEMWCAGLPYLETGDELEIKTKEGTARSYILTRQLTGIHDLMDTYTNGELDIF